MSDSLIKSLDSRARFDCLSGTLILGATGYIGSRLTSLMSAKPVSTKIAESEVKSVVHLAGTPLVNYVDALRLTNLNFSLASFAATTGARVLYCSSNNVYPFGQVNPSTTVNPSSLYELEKCVGERILMDKLHSNLQIWRLGDVFGLNQRHGNFFKALEKNAINNTPIRLLGSGVKRRSYVWVEDLALKIAEICNQTKPEITNDMVVNVCYSDSMSNAEIAQMFSDFFRLPIIHETSTDEDVTDRVMTNHQNDLFLGRSTRDALLDYFRQIEGAHL